MRDRRRGVMLASALVSAALHVAVLTLLFFAFRAILTPTGSAETVSETTAVAIERAAPQRQQPKRAVHPHREIAAAAPHAARHELARDLPQAPPQPPKRRSTPESSILSRDRAAFADEVAQLNKGNDPHAIPTIDPSSAQPASKSYSFDAHSTDGDDHGNGIIYPIKAWQDGGKDCYYARYTYTYASGAMEDGNIAWPVCFDPADDPFHRPPHPMPFPLPIAGYVLPPGTQLPPLEKLVYEQWAAANAAR